MNTLKFKTTIKCGSCITNVTPFLNEEKSIFKWNVDTASPEKILTVETNEVNGEKVIIAIEKAGYKIEPINN
jgi:copper chaperone